MDLMKMATQMLGDKLAGSAGNNQDILQSVVGELLGGGQNQGIDLGGLLKGLQSNGMAEVAKSWLGDGANEHISRSQVEQLLGSGQIQAAAAKLGADQNDLLRGLQDMIPQMMDQSSKGGEFLDSVGGLAGLASKLLK